MTQITKKPALIDPRLIGTWRSDRRLTFKHFTPSGKPTPRQFRRFKALFGKLVVRWTRQYQHTDLKGFKDREKYEIVAMDSVSVVVKSYDSVFEEDRVTQIFFESDFYWFWTPWGMREFFRRVN